MLQGWTGAIQQRHLFEHRSVFELLSVTVLRKESTVGCLRTCTHHHRSIVTEHA